MKNNDIEDLLERQSLTQPSDDLDARVAAAICESESNPPSPRGWLRAVIPFAAAAAVAFLLYAVKRPGQAPAKPTTTVDHSEEGRQSPAVCATKSDDSPIAPKPRGITGTDRIHRPEQRFSDKPIVRRATWSSCNSGQVLVLDGRIPIRPVVRHSVRHTEWVDPKTNVRIEQTVPKRELYLVATHAN